MPTDPLLIYDGDCAFCSSCVRAAQRVLPGDVPAIPWQRAPDLAVYGLTPEEAAESVRWVDSSGAVASGQEAVAHLLNHAGGAWSVVGRMLLLPLIGDVAEAVYRVIARNRDRLPGGTAACRLPEADADEGPAGR
jgi:predicted DCC family thiol-disulfide oxidoreductase YuxK